MGLLSPSNAKLIEKAEKTIEKEAEQEERTASEPEQGEPEQLSLFTPFISVERCSKKEAELLLQKKY